MLLVEEQFQCRICSIVSTVLEEPYPRSLAEEYPVETLEMYEACFEGATKHTGEGSIFTQLPTDINAYPSQHVDCHLTEATPVPLEFVFRTIGDKLSANLLARTDEFIETNESTIDELHEALTEKYNVAFAIPTHSQVHDIALPTAQLALGLSRKYGTDNAADRYLLLAKALNWYAYEGTPVPDVARAIANILFSLPRSKSGDKFDKDLQSDFNGASLSALERGIQAGGKIITLGTGGSTNYKIHWRDRVFAESQAAIQPGTVRLLTQENMLVLPIACYLDPETLLHTRLGRLGSLRDDDDCLQMGIWAAKEYSEMSGIHTLQARTRDQHERFAAMKANELRTTLARGIGFVAHLTRSFDDSNEQPEPKE